MILDTTPVLGPALGTPRQCATYIMARPHGEYTEVDIQEGIIPRYFGVCKDTGVDPLMVIAQMIHETGNLTSWWSQRPRRNPAGIGVTGRVLTSANKPKTGAWELKKGTWVEGIAFGNWYTSAAVHVGRLLAYALRDDQANALQQSYIELALNYRQLPSTYRGAASNWRGMNGRWAVPGLTYSHKLAELANVIVKEPK